MIPTHVVREDDKDRRVSHVTCGRCGGTWYVLTADEHQPSHCCYCGLKFNGYTDPNGTKRHLSGDKIE